MKKLYFTFSFILSMTFSEVLGQNITSNLKFMGITIFENHANPPLEQIITGYCDTTFSFGTTPIPTGLAWDGQFLWYVDTNFIYKVNSLGIRLDSIYNPAETSSDTTDIKGGGIVFDGNNLWYVDEQRGQLYKINPTTGNLIQQFNLPSFGEPDPNGTGLAWDGNNIWHCQTDPPRLYKINPLNGIITDSMITSKSIVEIEFVNGILYGVNADHIFKINQIDGSFEDSASWCIPFPVGLTWDGNNLFNLSGSGMLLGQPTGGRQKIYTIDWGNLTSIFDHTKSNEYTEVFPNPTHDIFSVKGENVNAIEVFSVTGKLIYSIINNNQQQSFSIDISNAPSGMYLMKISKGNRILSQKVLKH